MEKVFDLMGRFGILLSLVFIVLAIVAFKYDSILPGFAFTSIAAGCFFLSMD